MKIKNFTITLIISVMAVSLFAQAEKQQQSMKPALLVIDVQKKFMPMMSQSDMESAIQYMNWAIWVFRKHDLPVIRIYHSSKEYGVEPGNASFEFHDSIMVSKDDPMIIKTYPDAFNKTDLDKLLKEKGCNTLFLCGLSAVGCVLATYIGATDYDYRAFFVKDALLSQNAGYTNSIEEIFDAMSIETIAFMLEHLK